MTRLLAGLLLLAVGVALLLRCPFLDARPMHNDEAVNAVKFAKLWQHGGYRYDPDEHHGPALYYAALAVGRLTGAPADIKAYTDERLRLVTVLFGVALLLLLPLLTDGLGRAAMTWAALWLAVSPAFVFYSRYFIHEILLVFFTLLALAAGWRYWQSRKIGWVLLAGAGLGLMDATKETFVITLGAAVVAVSLNQAWNRLLDASGRPVKAPRLNPWHLAAGIGIWIALAVLLFSSFFTNPGGPLDSLRSYQPWLHRAGGDSPHIHPWHFYLHRLLFFHPAKGPVWTEALILCLAIIAGVAGFRRRELASANPSFVRFLALYTFLLTAFYSLLGYKTPWCLLNFWVGAALLAGVGAGVIIRSLKQPASSRFATILLLAGAAHLAWQAWQQDTDYAADRRNPYVYAQTSPDISKLVRKVEALADVSPQGRDMLIKAIDPQGDFWPLPWYLRGCTQIGWFEEMPKDPYAPVMIVSARLRAGLDERKTHLMAGYYQLRPDAFFELYVDLNLWRAYLAKHPPQPDSD
jgi:uncharacterized protein (TIGR03663 family)